MNYFEVLVEGGSDVPTVRELFERKFGLQEKIHFRIHPHKGRGRLPDNILAEADPKRPTLLDQLPAKLRGFSYLGRESCVVILVDADDTPPKQLLGELKAMLRRLPRKPENVVIRLAVEETESWFLADLGAVQKAFPKAKLQKLRNIPPDAIVGAWEMLADAIGIKRDEVTGRDKYGWAEKIAPYLNFDNPVSPSLESFVKDIQNNIDPNLMA
jgi:hypothetical protein